MLEATRRASVATVRSEGAWRWIGRRALIGWAALLAFLVWWQLLASSGAVRASLISSPVDVLLAGASLVGSGELTHHAAVSIWELTLGFLPAVVVGVLLGLGLGRFRRLRYLLEPLIMAAYTTPRVALLPVLIIWLGIGIESKIALVFLGSIFPIVVNTLAGVSQLDPIWERAARAFGARGVEVAFQVVLPGALPAVIAGLRLGLGRAIVSLIVGEMYVSVVGLGKLVQEYGNAGRAAELIALAGVIALFGLLGSRVLRLCEERLGRWR